MTVTTLDRILDAPAPMTSDPADAGIPRDQLVVFTLERQWFALPGAQVREILPPRPVYPLPGAPPALEGVIDLRGEIVSVLLLRVLLDLSVGAATDADGAILMGVTPTLHSGLRVGRVTEVLEVERDRLQPPPQTLPENWRPYVSALLEFGERAVAVLDLDRLFADYAEGRR